MNGVFTDATPGNENDFVDATPLSEKGFCVDVVLGSWTESYIGMIPGNDLASGVSQIN